MHSLQPEQNVGTLVRIPLKNGPNLEIRAEFTSRLAITLVAFANFRRTMTQPKTAINIRLDQSRKAAIERNISIIKYAAKAIHLYGKQGIPLRGHRDDGSSEASGNRGNCHALFLYAMEAGNTVLKKHIEEGPGNVQYTSKTIQNELIQVFVNVIRSDIIDEIAEAKFFSILSDEVTDNANLQQVSFVLRCVDKHNAIREEFLDFSSVDRITGEFLADLIISKLNFWGLSIKDCSGQGYASNMASAVKGVQARIRRVNEKVVYVHCYSHVLNLVTIKASSLPPVRNMAAFVTDVAYVFGNSPKRQRCLESVISIDKPGAAKLE